MLNSLETKGSESTFLWLIPGIPKCLMTLKFHTVKEACMISCRLL